MAQPPVCVSTENLAQQQTANPSPESCPPPHSAPYPLGQPVACPPTQPVAAWMNVQPQPPAQPVVAFPPGQVQPVVAYPPGQAHPVVGYPAGQAQPVVAYPAGQGQPVVAYSGQQVIATQGNAAPVHTGTAQGCYSGSAISEHYNAAAGLGTGVVHLVVAVLSIILGGAAYAFPVPQVGYGIWSAILFYIPTGILGVLSKYKNSRVVVAYMVMSILTSLHAIGMLIYEAFVAAVLTTFTSSYSSFLPYTFGRSVGATAVHSLLALLGLVEFINAIVSAAYCCNGHACCCAPSSAPSSTNQGAVTTPTVWW